MRQQRKGFSLLELVLVLGVSSALSLVKFEDMMHDAENLKASAAGQQIKQIGDAVDGYINIRYDKLSTLVSSTSQSSDPGPRTCDTGTGICTITSQTLVNEGLLPASYVSRNSFGSDYTIQLKRTGTNPNYVINGVVETNNPWIEGGKTRYDLLGKAMQSAGIDSGMSKSTNQISGYNGSWSYTSTDFPSITQNGVLGYRVGYDSAMYSVYLRRDGTLPMTGDLNMGGNNINNAKNITASGTGNFGGNIAANGLSVNDVPPGWSGVRTHDVIATGTLAVFKDGTSPTASNFAGYINQAGNMYAANTITAGGEITAHNGVGDAITLGGDSAGGAAADYELRLSSAKPLSIYSPNAAQYSTVLGVSRNSVFSERIATNGLDPNNLPPGWGGGVRTFDIYASATIAAGDNSGNVKSYMNSAGNIYASNDISASGNISGNGVYGNYVQSSGNIYSKGYIQGDGNITSSSQIIANSRLTTNEYVQINGYAYQGNGCSPNGLQGRAPDGSLLSCVNGVWSKAGGSTWQACRTCGGRWPYTIANFTLHGDSGVNFNGYSWGCGGGYTYGVPNDGDYMQLCASSPPN